MNHQLLAEPSIPTSDGRVRLRFPDLPGELDPINDLWAVPVARPDRRRPQVNPMEEPQ